MRQICLPFSHCSGHGVILLFAKSPWFNENGMEKDRLCRKTVFNPHVSCCLLCLKCRFLYPFRTNSAFNAPMVIPASLRDSPAATGNARQQRLPQARISLPIVGLPSCRPGQEARRLPHIFASPEMISTPSSSSLQVRFSPHFLE